MRQLLPSVITSVLFAGSFIAARVAVDVFRPLTLTWLRYVIALLVLGMMTGRSLRRQRGWFGRHLGSLIVLGLTGIVGYHYFFFKSVSLTSVTNTAIINAANPVVTGILAGVMLDERLKRGQYLGILLAVTGTILLVSQGTLPARATVEINRGDLLMIVAVLCWGIYAVVLRRVLASLDGSTATFGAMLIGVLVLTPLVFSEGLMTQFRRLSLEIVVAIVYMGAAASGLGYLLYTMSVRDIGPTTTAGVVYSLVPVLVAVLAALLFGEAITLRGGVSCALVIAGLLSMQRGTS